MEHIYTILNGHVEIGKKQCNIPFALVFRNDGVLYVESFFQKADFYDSVKGLNYYKLIGKTEKGYDIECEGLFCTQYKYNNQKVNFICEKYIKLTNNQDEGPQVENSVPIETPIYFSELEGLKMHFSDHTTTEQYQNSGKVDNPLNIDFDHTDCLFFFNHPDFLGNFYKIVFMKNADNNNILIDFSNSGGYSKLTNKKYQILKNDLLDFLSFINGGLVKVRKEFLGETLTIKSANKGFDAQTVIIYSFKQMSEFDCNDYLPIDNNRSYTSEIFQKAFLSGFDKFYHLNKSLDFSGLTYSLNSTNNVGLDERYFILITALERISNNYSSNNSDISKHLIDDKYFKETLKLELKSLLATHKSEINKSNKSAWDIINSKIGNLNRRNNSETSQKLYELLNYACINVSKSVINLIEKERNVAVHEGVIGTNDTERIKNYWKLDHVLRDIILNLIEYKGTRKRKYEYDKE
jgi:hypothetical protein